MSTVKISELPEITHYSTNTEATLVVGVDLSTGTTGKSTLTTLGEGLYAYQPLKVGENQVLFSNTIGQFSGNSNTYLQVNNQNFNANGSADYVASTSDSDNSNKYIDMGVNGSTFNDSNFSSMKPYDGYLYTYGASATSTSGNLVIGTASSFANIVYIVGGTIAANIVARMSKTALEFSSGYALKFGDGSVQTTSSNPASYSTAAYAQANVTVGVDATQNTRLSVIEGTDITQNTNISSTDGKMSSAYNQANSGTVLAQAAFNVANTAVQNTAIVQLQSLTLTGNLIANSGRLNVSSTIYAANGIINRVSQYPSTQTAITISMTTDTWVKCNVGASLAITPTSFVSGAEVVVIVTNPNSGGGAARTITHGGSAYNSSVGATTFNLSGTTTAFIKYYSLSNDLANTYVQVTYS